MIPVKDNVGDPVTWRYADQVRNGDVFNRDPTDGQGEILVNARTDEATPNRHDLFRSIRVSMHKPENVTLGCSIYCGTEDRFELLKARGLSRTDCRHVRPFFHLVTFSRICLHHSRLCMGNWAMGLNEEVSELSNNFRYCYICSPGVFVQSIRLGSLAEEVGLDVDDEIVSVNGARFRQLRHSEAVINLKTPLHLDMVVRRRVKGT